jgi:hypothetical protein
MSWDVGYMGTCPACGLRVHAAYEDHSWTVPVWTYCAHCEEARVRVEDARQGEVDESPGSCAGCTGPLLVWDVTRCPRCGAAARWDAILAAN